MRAWFLGKDPESQYDYSPTLYATDRTDRKTYMSMRRYADFSRASQLVRSGCKAGSIWFGRQQGRGGVSPESGW
jgi:hypothetical protein